MAYFGLCGLLLLQLKYETKLSKKNSGDLPVIGHSMNTEMFGRKHTPQISELYVELPSVNLRLLRKFDHPPCGTSKGKQIIARAALDGRVSGKTAISCGPIHSQFLSQLPDSIASQSHVNLGRRTGL